MVPMGLSFSTALAFAVTVVLTLTLRPFAVRLCITDNPGGRKQHIGEIPLVGGVAMFIGILVATMAAVQTTGGWALLGPRHGPRHRRRHRRPLPCRGIGTACDTDLRRAHHDDRRRPVSQGYR